MFAPAVGLSDSQVSRGCQTAEFPPRDDATGEPVEPTERDLAMLTANLERLLELRKHFSNLSWFMRCLCEKIELG